LRDQDIETGWAPTADEIDEVDALLRESLAATGLDHREAKRRTGVAGCFPNEEGRSLEYRFTGLTREQGVTYVRDLGSHWSSGPFMLNGPNALEPDGTSLLATAGRYRFGADWFDGTKVFVVGGNTGCGG
jgi:hypothetical protein